MNFSFWPFLWFGLPGRRLTFGMFDGSCTLNISVKERHFELISREIPAFYNQKNQGLRVFVPERTGFRPEIGTKSLKDRFSPHRDNREKIAQKNGFRAIFPFWGVKCCLSQIDFSAIFLQYRTSPRHTNSQPWVDSPCADCPGFLVPRAAGARLPASSRSPRLRP